MVKTGIRDYFNGKVIFLTGATGLVGKVLVEKILHDIPDIGRIYVLIRPGSKGIDRENIASDRMWREVLGSTAFDPLREIHKGNLDKFAKTKVIPIAGDLGSDRLGLPEDIYDRLQSEVQIVISCAAVVSFDAPLDWALRLNALGPKRILEFAAGCRDAMLVHVSTCYVNGTRDGQIEEEPLDPTQTIGHIRGIDNHPYDVDQEIIAIQSRLQTLRERSRRLPAHWFLRLASTWKNRSQPSDLRHRAHITEMARLRRARLTGQMVTEGMRWAHRRGWNDTYTFTKAMGEQMVVRYHGKLPTLIVRPSIIESGMHTPQPGWLDGFRMLDPLIVAYGRGRLPDFPGLADGILDIVPADVVVNALLAAVPWAHRKGGLNIYQIASGMENPITPRRLADLVQDYFQRHPLLTRDAQARTLAPITFPSRKRFLRKLEYFYLTPLRTLEGIAALGSMTSRGRRIHRKLQSRHAALERLTYYIRIYGPYAEVRCQYLTHNMRQVWESLSVDDQSHFNFDVKTIDWPSYLQKVHIPGIKRFLLGMNATTPPEAESSQSGKFQDATTEQHFEDVEEEREEPLYGELISPISDSLLSTEVDAISPRQILSAHKSGEDIATALGLSQIRDEEVERWLQSSVTKRTLRAFVRWLMGIGFRYYLGFRCDGLDYIPQKGPFILVANHTSHIDTGAILVATGRKTNVLHPMAAKDYFFSRRLRGWLVHTALGAIAFDREAHIAESLGLAVGILRHEHALIFYPEGGRSSTGEVQPFKRGIGLLVLASGAPVIPTSIKGTFDALPKGKFFLRRHSVTIRFGPPIDANTYLEDYRQMGAAEVSRRIASDAAKAVELLRHN